MNVDIDDLRDVLDDLASDGRTYVTARQVAREMEHSSREVGYALAALEDDGEVGRWGSSTPTTWKILRD